MMFTPQIVLTIGPDGARGVGRQGVEKVYAGNGEAFLLARDCSGNAESYD